MTQQAHPGYEADPDEVRALLDNLLDEAWGSDPTTHYIDLVKTRALLDAASAECTRRAALAVEELNNDGMSYDAIAAHLGLSKPRVQQLVNLARTKA